MDRIRNAHLVNNSSHDIVPVSISTAPAAFPLPSETYTIEADDISSANDRVSVVYAPRSSQSIQRNASPSHASVRSAQSASSSVTTSSVSVPHLRHERGNKHMRHLQSSGHSSFDPPKTNKLISNPSIFNNSDDPPSRQSLSSRSVQSQLARSNTAPSPKRPPASHSSYGVETIVGPPPSFDTRRTNSTERVWRVDRSKSLRMTLGAERLENSQQQVAEAAADDTIVAPKPSYPTTPLLAYSSPDTADIESIPTPTDAEDLATMDAKGYNEHGLGLSQSEAESKSSGGSHGSEDLFLNIARVDSGRPPSSKGDQRKSRMSLPFLPDTRPSTSHAPESARSYVDSSILTPRADSRVYHGKRASLQFSRLQGVDQISDTGSVETTPGYSNRRSSAMYADTIRGVQRSAATLRNNRLVSESGYGDKSRFGEQNTTESTVSTTAPSTVWDELDDLKSRIRRLEVTGKLPPSSAAAMSSAERPRTATTAATTMSSSPKHTKAPTQLPTTVEGVSPVVHPLLQEALGNAKAVVSHDVYQKLQSTAQDALQLASLTTYDTAGTSRNSASAMTDRQIRRRTESLCRSLTELAIALSTEQRSSQQTYRPGSRDQHISPAMGLRSRTYSQSNGETADRLPPSVRVQSRLESRRVSAQPAYATNSNATPITAARHVTPDLESPTALPPYPYLGPNTRTTRVASTFRARRSHQLFDDVNDEDDPSPGARPVSRAMTDIAAARRVSRDHAALAHQSREYTSQHPMPAPSIDSSTVNVTRTPLPAGFSTNLVSRRKLHSPAITVGTSNLIHTAVAAADSSPLASRQSWGRISVIQPNPPPLSDVGSDVSGSVSAGMAVANNRSVSTRRSLGFASRLGSSVGNRLRAAKAERTSYLGSSPPISREVSREEMGTR